MAATRFEIVGRDGAGRLGRFKTAHGIVDTPTLLPVVNPNLHLLTPKEMRDKFGMQMLITNSYIIWKKKSLHEKALAEGVHGLIDWDGPVMTDSGTFQMYVYGSVEVKPEEIVAFQRDIGVDVGTILDIFSTPDRTHEEADADLTETLARARTATTIKGDAMALAATVQGGVYPDLRAKCAEAYGEVAADFHPIGGVVPLMEQQRYRTLAEVVIAAKQRLPADRPVHLFGAGHPLVFPMAALLGCDFFDSAAYAKYAADGRMIFATGTKHVKDMTENPCTCPVCATHSLDDLKKGPDKERLLAEHNLHVSFAEIRRVREAIRTGTLWELVEQRARAHPALLDALRAIVKHTRWMETLEPLSKPSAFFYAGPESGRRSEVVRARERLLSRFDPRGRDVVLFDGDVRKPWSQTYRELMPRLERLGAVPAARTVFGPVPFLLDETYPFAQSAEPSELDAEVTRDLDLFVDTFASTHGVRVVPWPGSVDALAKALDVEGEGDAALTDPDEARMRAMADWQFGPGAGDALLAGDVDIRKSRRTHKIRTVHVDGEHVLSLRAEDGLFTLKIAGARRLHAAFPFPALRVVVEGDSVPFNREGKNAFAKFVGRVDAGLRARDECLVVDWSDRLVATGQLLLAPSEIPAFESGVAVNVREGNPEA